MQTLIASGKCPKCSEVVSQALIEDLPAARFMETPGYRAASYLCPKCKTILGVAPSATEIAAHVVNQLTRDQKV